MPHRKAGEGRNLGYDRWKGTGGLPEWGLLKGFLDFMGQCKPQRTDNLFLLYAQNPEIRQVKTFENGRKKAR